MATGIGYKLFRLRKDGQLYPLYVLANKPTPMGVWLKAESGIRTEKGKVKSKLGELAYRPGRHLNDDAPYVNHIYSVHGGKRYLKDNCVWAEVEYKTDVPYQEQAHARGFRNGKWSAGRAQLDYVPRGGFYKYKTNPNMNGAWVIAGEIKVNRILCDDEVLEICQRYGYEPLVRYQKGA